MDAKIVPLPVKKLPSQGNFYPEKHHNGQGKDTIMYVKQMSYKQVQIYEAEMAECKMLTQKLLCKIEHLITEEFRDAPVCDMYSIMTYKCLFSIAGKRTKFILNGVTCNKCGKTHDKLELDISQILFSDIEKKLLTGTSVMLGGVKFSFTMPSIRAFEVVLKQLMAAAKPRFARKESETNTLQYLARIRTIEIELIKTALLISAFNSYEYMNEMGDIVFQTDPNNIREVLDSVTEGDIVLLEVYHNFLLSPVSYVSDFCDCGIEPGPSVALVSDIVTEVLRQLYANSKFA